MKRTLFIFLLMATLMPAMTQAQQRRTAARKPKVTTPAEDPKLTSMLGWAAQVTIIDSVVTDSAKVLAAFPFNPEEGQVVPAGQFFGNNDIEGYAYVNELGNRCIFSRMGRGGHMRLYQRYKVGGTWADSEELKGLDDGGQLTDLNHPYLMPDGITLYFTARGAGSLGGYDIYRSRLDTEEGVFLRPENVGLPFNSDADDFLYVVDEQHQLAYFATTRRQPKGKVCVYTFIPTDTRQVLQAEAYTPEKLRSLARIDRIADTWGSGAERKKALQRREQAARNSHETATGTRQEAFAFVINDRTTYTRLSDFRLPDNQRRFRELQSMQKQAQVLQASLTKARNFYATASDTERRQLRGEIVSSERQLDELRREIAQTEKTIRNTENQ